MEFVSEIFLEQSVLGCNPKRSFLFLFGVDDPRPLLSRIFWSYSSNTVDGGNRVETNPSRLGTNVTASSPFRRNTRVYSDDSMDAAFVTRAGHMATPRSVLCAPPASHPSSETIFFGRVFIPPPPVPSLSFARANGHVRFAGSRARAISTGRR